MSLQDEEIVISGISGRFPETDNLIDLSEKLFNGTDFLTPDLRKFTKGFFENLPTRNGKLTSELTLFDYTYFGISKIVASAMDSMICQFLERTFEAVIDAGINPSELRGTNSSVFTGTCHSDSDLEWSSNVKVGYGIMGRNRCMNSNRISYWLDLNGTSYSTDCGWANGISTLYQGWNAIKSGKSDTAIVGVCSLQNVALPAIQLKDFGVLSPDGYTRSFDDSANGWGRSSAIVVLVLQRASIARRKYATIGHVASTVVSNDKVINHPTQKDWETMLSDFYEKSKIDVNDIYYVEAHGSGIKKEDAAELNALENIFCKNRKSPLLIGSVKSNMGHCESSSALCGLVKAIIAMEKGQIPANLHYNKPNSLCPGLFKGTLKVVSENTPLPPNAWIAVNSHSFGGTYGHVVIKPNLKNKVIFNDQIPRLVLLADRTNDFMADLFDKVESTPYDHEYVALLHEIHSKKVERYFGRGYTILPKPETPIHESQVFNEEKRPLWFIFSGMGSQWPGMGKRLMDLPLFKESIERSHKVLATKGLNLIKIITDEDPQMFDNILHSFVGIAAIQIAIIDVLRTLNITPDGIIGHSVGELGCSYADGCFTSEQMILAAYFRGKASVEAELIQGSMAAIGKQHKDIESHLPSDIDIACHNSSDNCTISGPSESISKFVTTLKENNVFAKVVNVSNIAYHSRYIRPAAPGLLKYLKEIIPEPKLRSSKWISTSHPEDKWDTETAKYCSAEYHTNNLLSCVLFQEGSKHIPKNAICIEIAPHGLLQAILKRSLGDEVTNIPLTSRFSSDPLIFFLQALGKVYMAGVDFSVMNLYPKVEFPVSKGTQSLSNLPHWHEQKLCPIITPIGNKIIHSLKNCLIASSKDGLGVIINGKNKYPLSIFVGLLWELFAAQNKQEAQDCPVVIEDFKLNEYVDVNLSEDDNKAVYFLNGTGSFEIVHENHSVGSGIITKLKEKSLPHSNKTIEKPDLVGSEIYDELRRRGYTFGKHFENLMAVSFGKNEILAEIPASADWHQIVEAMIQLHLLHAKNYLYQMAIPISFEVLEISSLMHITYRNTLGQNGKLLMEYELSTNTVICGNITLKRLKYVYIPRINRNLNFQSIDFFPFTNTLFQDFKKFSDYCFDIMISNLGSAKKFCGIKILEVIDNECPKVNHLPELHSDIEITVETISKQNIASYNVKTIDLAVCLTSYLNSCMDVVVEDGFILVKATSNVKIPSNLTLITKFVDRSQQEYMFLKKIKAVQEELRFIDFDKETEASLTNRLKELKPVKDGLITYLVTRKKPAESIEVFQAKIQEKTIVLLRWLFIFDSTAPPFDVKLPFYNQQLKKGLLTNVYCNGNWGHFYKYSLKDDDLISKNNFKLDDENEVLSSYISFDPAESIINLEQIEYSGTLNGKRVMGITKMLNHRKIIIDQNLTWEIPKSWSLEDGATVPASYALAYYSLIILNKIKWCKKILVTDALSCIGQAHVAVALSYGCRVYVTVSSNEEIAVIKKKFPQIKDSDIKNHNDPKFEIDWQLESKDNLMNVLINMLDDEKFFSALRLVAGFGYIFHFGKEDIRKNSQLSTFQFLITLSLYCLTPDTLSKIPEDDKEILHGLLEEGIKKGVVKPLPRLITTMKQFEESKSKLIEQESRYKSLVKVENFNSDFVNFDSKNSYLILGDETDLWVDVVEWLINRKTTKIIVGRRDTTKRGSLRALEYKNSKTVILQDHLSVEELLVEAQKLGHLSAVFYISMNSTEETDVFKALGDLYSNPKSHLIVISKSRGQVSDMCTSRNRAGLPSTNYIWEADTIDVNANFEFMSKLCGKNPVIYVTPPAQCLTAEYRLGDLLPSSIEDFCKLGSSLKENVEIVPLNTLAGCKQDYFREITPFIIIPGLQNEPLASLESIFANFLYPAACVKIPDLNLSIEQMVIFILPEVIKYNKGNYYNIIGMSWGSHLAMELTKQLEKIDAIVGLILIEGPVLNAQSLITKSLEWDILNLIEGKFKASANFKVKNGILPETSWKVQVNSILNALSLPKEKERNFSRGANFVYNNLKALLEYDITKAEFAGPLTVIVSGQRNFDDKVVSKICKNISIRYLPVSGEELMNSKDLWKIIHGSAVSPSMSDETVHSCTWPALEAYVNQKDKIIPCQDTSLFNLKFFFSC